MTGVMFSREFFNSRGFNLCFLIRMIGLKDRNLKFFYLNSILSHALKIKGTETPRRFTFIIGGLSFIIQNWQTSMKGLYSAKNRAKPLLGVKKNYCLGLIIMLIVDLDSQYNYRLAEQSITQTFNTVTTSLISCPYLVGKSEWFQQKLQRHKENKSGTFLSLSCRKLATLYRIARKTVEI